MGLHIIKIIPKNDMGKDAIIKYVKDMSDQPLYKKMLLKRLAWAYKKLGITYEESFSDINSSLTITITGEHASFDQQTIINKLYQSLSKYGAKSDDFDLELT
jgi:hypothetical protein